MREQTRFVEWPLLLVAASLFSACSASPAAVRCDGAMCADASTQSPDAAPFPDIVPIATRDSSPAISDAASFPDVSTFSREVLAHQRSRVFQTFVTEPRTACETWAALDESQRAVFLTITHRFFISRMPEGSSVLSHIDRLYAVLGGGSSGTTCGGSENNRLFMSMDEPLWRAFIASWDRVRMIQDGKSGYWMHTNDLAGPHAPFNASSETESGLRCALILELPASKPPTGQAHYFLEGTAQPISRGSTNLPLDQQMLEIDLDFNCLHDSNPTCRDFTDRYARNMGAFECDWVPSGCSPVGTGCYRGAI